MSNRVAFLFMTVAAIAAGILACGSDSNDPGVILTPGVATLPPGIQISVRNDQGIAIAQGTSAVVVGLSDSTSRSFVADSLTIRIYVGPGTYTVRLSKPLYRDTTLTNIVVQGADFGSLQTTDLSVTLHAAPSTSVVRSVAIFGEAFLDRPGAEAHLSAVVDAPPGMQRAVRWSVDDTSLATIARNGVIAARCSARGGTVTTTARSVADDAVFSTVRIAVAPASSC